MSNAELPDRVRCAMLICRGACLWEYLDVANASLLRLIETLQLIVLLASRAEIAALVDAILVPIRELTVRTLYSIRDN